MPKTPEKTKARTAMPSPAEFKKLSQGRTMFLAKLYAGAPGLPTGNTWWEELTCVGYNPETSLLEAVISVKQPTGYCGGICSSGSQEYVRFFIDWGDGHGFTHAGLASIRVSDISDAPKGPQHPLMYLVTLPLDFSGHQRCCWTAVLPKVRAVLSWNALPSLDPDDTPYYGNALDAAIQLKPYPFCISCLIEKGVKIDKNLMEILDIHAPLPLVQKPVPMVHEMAEQYLKAGVPKHRIVYPAVYPLVKGKAVATASAVLPDKSWLLKHDIDLKLAIDTLAETKADVSFEEVICAGLCTPNDTLGAVIHVKKPSGYSGSLCDKGSVEYVAFWADWNNNGTFDEYLGTAQVTVHDIDTIPAEGLYYGVTFPVNLTGHLSTCTNPSVVRIRAVLSWAIPPSTTDPSDLTTWGNSLDVVVQVREGTPDTGMTALIYKLGGVAIESISQDDTDASLRGLAFPTSILPVSASADPGNRPFGGLVYIQGRLYNTGPAGTVHFTVEYKPRNAPDVDASWAPVTTKMTFTIMDPSDVADPHKTYTQTCPDGWFTFLEDMGALPYPLLERDNMLGIWDTGALNGEFHIRVRYTEDYPLTPGSVIHKTASALIRLDNTRFSVNTAVGNTSVDLSSTLDIAIEAMDCPNTTQGETLTGHLRVIHPYFWYWNLDLQPSGHVHGNAVTPPLRLYASVGDTGDGNLSWSVDTGKLDPCGYTLTVWGRDRAILNSNGAIWHWDRKAVGFCVKKKP
ncbi:MULTISPECIES: hypothetical protein [unclassified Methanoregula]|uniref:hypothetical protein n=1 Tax=unclassified Methanoregula TaxID=2649730 RepID=UPI0025FFBD83|nr:MULTISPECIES: hypothetical protein [unclassified Methanoregula]